MNRTSKILLVLVIVAVLGLAGLITYSVVKPDLSPRLSEFCILNAEGKAENYPRQVQSGSPVIMTVTVINNETIPTAYRVKITCAGDTLKEVTTGQLAQGEKWQQQMSFSLQSTGQNQKVDFQLYKDGENELYFKEPLYMYLDVTE